MSRAGTDAGGIRQKPEPGHAYNLPRLHRIFFWSSLLMLLSIVFWVVKVDYDRSWKHYQRQFTRIQFDETRKAIEGEEKKLAGGSNKQKLSQLEAQLQKAEADVHDRKADVDRAQKRLEAADNGLAKTDSRTRAAKAKYDAFRYKVEEVRLDVEAGRASQKHLDTALEKLGKREKEKNDAALAFEQATAERDSAQAVLGRLTSALTTTQKDLGVLYANKKRLEKRLATLQNDFVNVVRNSPMMDFIAPSLKIQQTVIEDLRFEVNYQTIPRVDRCTTCHQGIDKNGY